MDLPAPQDLVTDLPPLPPPRPPPALASSVVSSLFRSASTPPSLSENSWGCWPRVPRARRPPSAPSSTTHYVPFWSPSVLPAPPEVFAAVPPLPVMATEAYSLFSEGRAVQDPPDFDAKPLSLTSSRPVSSSLPSSRARAVARPQSLPVPSTSSNQVRLPPEVKSNISHPGTVSLNLRHPLTSPIFRPSPSPSKSANSGSAPGTLPVSLEPSVLSPPSSSPPPPPKNIRPPSYSPPRRDSSVSRPPSSLPPPTPENSRFQTPPRPPIGLPENVAPLSLSSLWKPTSDMPSFPPPAPIVEISRAQPPPPQPMPSNSRPPSLPPSPPPLPAKSVPAVPPALPKSRPPTRPPPDPPSDSSESPESTLEEPLLLLPPPPSFQTPPERRSAHVSFVPGDEYIPPEDNSGGYLDSRDALGVELTTPAVVGGLSVDARSRDTDLLFLQSLINKKNSVDHSSAGGNLRLALQLSEECDRVRNSDAWELADLLRKPHLKALLDTHDVVKEQSGQPDILWEFQQPEIPVAMATDAVRMVGLRKNPNEPLGMTVQVDDNGNLVIARILAGGMIERQGMLHAGDVILEVNGYPVESPEMLQDRIADSKEAVTLKIAPGKEETTAHQSNGRPANVAAQDGVNSVCFMRALFSYNPLEDTLLPCKEIGLEFQHGDILQIVNQRDPNWWQAKKVGWNGPAGLIPSQELEERRKAFVAPEADYVHKIGICGTRVSKKKKKVRYQSKANTEYDKAELLLYEEVTRMPPFKRKTLALIGSQGVGRRTLKNRLINSDPDKFGTVIPYTSRPQREYEDNGKSYWFTDRESMEMDIRHHKFLEYGEHNGHLYGTTLDSVREVIHQGKMCVLDCSPAALKVLHNSSEFMPYVIFIAAPGMEQLKSLHNFGRGSRNFMFDRQSSIRFSSQRARTLQSLSTMFGEEDLLRTVEESACMQRTYEKYIDQVIVNEDHDDTFRKVLELLDTLSTEHQWVPVNWVY